ncbi:hypothetical protein FHG87_022932 [Trinorchestia longiramus]|nr:hypothetical protein FHG87_022932 [Trinorchestia longiramus]
MQEMSSVKEKWCLKAANREEFDKELGKCVGNRNGNVNDMNKEMEKCEECKGSETGLYPVSLTVWPVYRRISSLLENEWFWTESWRGETELFADDIVVYGLNKWKHSMNGKTILTWYVSKNVPRFEMFYDGSFGSQLLFAIRYKALSVNRCKWRWNEGNTRLCLQCNRRVEETIEHLVLECSKYECEQESLRDVVHEQCGENKWIVRCVEEDSGMRYLVELDEECNMTVVDAMKDFLVHAWNKQQ